MKAKDMYVQPGYLFRRMHQRATSAFGAVNSDRNVTPVQFAALLTVRDNPGIDATRLAESIRFDRTTIGHVIGRLEQKKLIVRKEGSLDKRTKQLRITAAGSALLDDMGSRIGEISALLLAPLTETERRDLMQILIKLDRFASEENGFEKADRPVRSVSEE